MSIDTEYFRALLLERRAQLNGAGPGDREAAVALDQARVGRLSRMEARRRGQERVRIENALRRIDDGDYGECENCGNDIAEGRLRIDPSAQLCVGCAAERERK